MSDERALIREVMPNGDEFWRRESDHSYWGAVTRNKDGTVKGGTDRFTGVSTAAKPADFSKDALMYWAANLTCDGVAELAAPLVRDLGDPNLADELAEMLADGKTLTKQLRRAGLTWADLRDRKARIGTNVHEHFLAALARGEQVPSLERATVEERGYAQGVLAFWRDHRVEAEQVEQPMCARSLRVAGRPDLRGMIDGGPAILDLKTGMFDSNADHVQVEGYEICARESGYGATEIRYILRVSEHGGYVLTPSSVDAIAADLGLPNSRAVFEATLTTYRLAGKLASRAAARRKKAR